MTIDLGATNVFVQIEAMKLLNDSKDYISDFYIHKFHADDLFTIIHLHILYQQCFVMQIC